MGKTAKVEAHIGAPHQGMSHQELVARHKQLETMLKMELGRPKPDEVKIRRIKCLKVLYKNLIEGLSQK